MVTYKVVRILPLWIPSLDSRPHNVYYSAASIKYIEYRIGIPTYRIPKWGPLTAFRTLEQAKAFKKNYWTSTAIFSCSITKTKLKMRHRAKLLWVGTGDWNLSRYFLPKGTVLCDSITLLKRIL